MEDLRLLLSRVGIDYKERGVNVGSNHINICCPFCEEVRYHCGIHETERWFKCFVCGIGGKSYKLEKKLRDAGYKINLYPEFDNFLDESSGLYKKKEKPANLPAFRELQKEDEEWKWLNTIPKKDDISSFRSRGVPEGKIKESGALVGLENEHYDLRGHVVWNEDYNIIARRYKRSVIKDKAKWLKWTKSDYIFNSKICKQMNTGIGVITEGVFDCLRVPFGTGVAILSSNFTQAVVAAISDTFAEDSKLIIALDRDVSQEKVENGRLSLCDLGYEVSVVDWRTVPKHIKDLDELWLYGGDKMLEKFLGFSFLSVTKELY